MSKLYGRNHWYFPNGFTETPLSQSFLNIFQIRFFQCITHVLVLLYFNA